VDGDGRTGVGIVTDGTIGRRPGIGASHLHMDPEDDVLWEAVRPRTVTVEQWDRFQGYVAEILGTFGMDLDTPGTSRTPERFLRALLDSTAGYEGDPKLLTAFPTECRGGSDCRISQIIEGPISFFALCEHHALPFHGVAHVGYVAHENIIGISKLTRLVRMFARRFTVQERIGQQVADALGDLMQPHGVAVHLEAVHLCTQMRGVREEGSSTWTSFWRGTYDEEPELRQSFLQAVTRPR
jgi:GTP cyclohydrolase IA